MNTLAHELVKVCQRNRDGSHATQAVRKRGLIAIAKDLYALGYKVPKAQSIKPKHVHTLLEHWQAQGLSTGTIKNRLGWVRWWTHKVNKASILPRTNRELGIENKQVNPKSRAKDIVDLPRLSNPRMQLALELMQNFGLRFEETLKLKPKIADQQTTLNLQASWTKGGRARVVPIRTKAQRHVLNQLAKVVGSGSLIPAHKSYIQFRKAMEHELAKAGINNVHGLRHHYAQTRYHELTGWQCPQAGGPISQELNDKEKRLDRQVRLMISEEIGHSRLQITKVYLG